MSENIRKQLGIDDLLELVKEDKNLDSAYISFAQYMDILEKENRQLKNDLKILNEVLGEAGMIKVLEWKTKKDLQRFYKWLDEVRGVNNEQR